MTKFSIGDRVTVDSPKERRHGQTGTLVEIEHPSYVVYFGDKDMLLSASASELKHAAPEQKPEAQKRKDQPVTRGVIDYFPDALLAVAELSRIGNEQHNAGQPMHWAFSKSTDEADCIVRHLLDRGTLDTDGVPHSAKVAWRALALLQREIERADPELHARRQAKRDATAKGELP